ncbi:peptide-methionine (S)-S-oxide reductase MsrA [Adhaeribacter aquaticus]|uniref:peptide-methionine (S)-S-oxide reductase MsrA n=1 Tax=Adhaeribacter aquaticus TaxID=299567 RepID=UPI000422183F|nr:peptide-methionine (S)-S-oxide reductase MsrA [Adhaeribacter aquaticus]
MKRLLFLLPLFLLFLASCTDASSKQTILRPKLTAADLAGTEKAIFAGGCFWCTEAVFERVQGVKQVISGYAGGKEKNPTYEQVSSGLTGHAEAVQVYYDPKVITYKELLEMFFVAHDPTTLNRQGPDVGRQYRSAIFYQNEEQQQLAEAYIKELDNNRAFPKKIVTEVKPLTTFWLAEDYHQNYYDIAENRSNPYIMNVTAPKVHKFEKHFKTKLKPQYQKGV